MVKVFDILDVFDLITNVLEAENIGLGMMIYEI
jgi:hypothetical protein